MGDWNQIKIVKQNNKVINVGGIYLEEPLGLLVKYGICDKHGSYILNGYILKNNIKAIIYPKFEDLS